MNEIILNSKKQFFEKCDTNNNNANSVLAKESFKSVSSLALVPHDKNNIDSVKVFALSVCREYLGGVWKLIDLYDFKIEKPSGGLTNYLYKCEIINKKFKSVRNEPTGIFLRLYGENHNMNSSMLKDVVVSAIMSDYSVGPKLYGVFPSGRLEELLYALPMDQDDMYVPVLSGQIAEVMASFHTLYMPFIKEPNWLFDTIDKYINQMNELRFVREIDNRKFNEFKKLNLKNEFDNLKKQLIAVNSQVVFCHNDINVGNIMKLSDKLMIIDYEYSGYNYRGFDFGNHFCEWMFNNNYDKHPYFQYTYELYPNREQQLNFVRAYIKKFKEIYHRRKLNELNDVIEKSSDEEKEQGIQSMEEKAKKEDHVLESLHLNEEQLMKEANYFALASHLFWAFWGVCQAGHSKIQFEFFDYSMARCDAYFKQKPLLFDENFQPLKN